MTSAHALNLGGHPGRQGGFDLRRAMAYAMSGGRGPGRHHRHGPPFGPGGPWGPGPGFGGPYGRRRRMRRGDVRAAILVLLDEQPLNGYGLMQEIERRSEGAWRPSPGSVYPALSQLEDEGLVRADEEAGRKAVALTDEGRAYVAEHREELGEPWAQAADEGGSGRRELRSLLGQIGAAAMQVSALGTDAQVEEARRLMNETRRSLYRLLADDEPAEEA